MVANSNKIELVVEVDVNKANASIKSVNASLFSMEQGRGKLRGPCSATVAVLVASALVMLVRILFCA